MDQREKLIEKQVKEKCDLVDVISYATRDWEDYLDECLEEEIPPIDTCEDFIADSILHAGYRKQSEGEWRKVYQNDKATVYECSNCHHLSFGTSDYCICGANMKGGTEILYTPVADVVQRSESARDFEALENTVTQIYNRYVFESNEYSDDDEAIEAVMNALTDVSNAIYELKEKHTKGGEE